MYSLQYSTEKPAGFFASEDRPSNVSGSFETNDFEIVARDSGSLNRQLGAKLITVEKCKDCGMHYVFPVAERRYFEKNNLPIPKRCKCCREKRKAAAKQQVLSTAQKVLQQTCGA